MWQSKLNKNCGFSNFLNNCNNSLFCNNLTSRNFMLFNKPIEQEKFYKIFKEFEQKILDEDIKICTYEIQGYIKIKEINRIENIFKISKSFKDWIKTLPNFDPFIMYQISFDESWLN